VEYYILNKPSGCITARRDPRHKTVMDYLPEEKRDLLFPVGRLDRDTEGLLIITDDGLLAQSLLHPKAHVSKTYFFYALGTLTEDAVREIEGGIRLYPTRDVVSAPAKITVLGTSTLSSVFDKLSEEDKKRARKRPDTPVICGTVTVTEGKKHEVKRMLMYAGCRIVYLKRISMGGLNLDKDLPTGAYRPLTDEEIHLLKENKKA